MQLQGLGEHCKPKSNLIHFSLEIWHLVAPICHFPWLFPDFSKKKIFPLTFPDHSNSLTFSSFLWPVETLCLKHLAISCDLHTRLLSPKPNQFTFVSKCTAGKSLVKLHEWLSKISQKQHHGQTDRWTEAQLQHGSIGCSTDIRKNAEWQNPWFFDIRQIIQ